VPADETRALKHHRGKTHRRWVGYGRLQERAEGAQLTSLPLVESELKRETICRLSAALHTGHCGAVLPWRAS